MFEYGHVFIEGVKFKAIRFMDSGIVQVYKSRRPERVSRAIAKTFRSSNA